MDAVLFVCFRLRQKLQNAGWEPEVERWESDEESDDGEDDEQDFYAATVDLTVEAILALCA